MIREVKINKKLKSGGFVKFLDKKKRERLVSIARKLKGKKIIQINATPVGGGVAELLRSLIPYLRSLGIDASWYYLDPRFDRQFFKITNKLHNALQGANLKVTEEEWAIYQDVNRRAAKDIKKIGYDLLVVNDHQPAAVAHFLNETKPKIYYNHIDTSSPNHRAWFKLRKILDYYAIYIFSNASFVNKTLPKDKVRIFAPAIDPFNIKQKIVPKAQARKYLAKFGLPAQGPLIAQISRFDVWKNPAGVLGAFRAIQDKYPKTQLAFVGLMEAMDNPEAIRVYKEIKEMVGKDSRVHLFFDPDPRIKSIAEFTMYFQNAADIIIQNSIKEGFGLTVSEALWKKKAVIGGPASGVRKQIKDGWNGYIAKNDKELAEKMADLLESPAKRKKFGENGRKFVTQNFLFPRLVLDHLKAYEEVL